VSVFEGQVLAAVSRLQAGEVATYGEIAAEAGRPGAARAVGNALRGSGGTPWWRVVTATGRLVPGLEREQARLLAGEGVPLCGDPPRVAVRGRTPADP
jgi:methylated-DNA-protein-cysteine methyltransferase related protein